MEKIREAARTANIEVLYTIIHEDPYVLERIDQLPFVDNPFHIAAAEGHINFAMEMINLKPSFARKLNQDGWSPIHLALKNERTDLVLRLLETDKDLVRVKGRQGMTPSHIVPTTGNISLLLEFLEACPECIDDVTVNGDTALHIALKNDQIEAFSVLVRWLARNTYKNGDYWERNIVNLRDNEGNTVLHIAGKRKQHEAVELLLDNLLNKIDIGVVNSEGLTAFDIIQPGNVERRDSFMIRYFDSLREGTSSLFLYQYSREKYLRKRIWRWQMFLVQLARMKTHLSIDLVNTFLVIMALIITATYQSSLSPPGGVWQGGDNGSNNSSIVASLTSSTVPKPFHVEPKQAGTTVMSSNKFLLFWLSNHLTLWITILITSWLLPSVPFFSILLTPLYFLGFCYQYSIFIISPTTGWSLFHFCYLIVATYLQVNIALYITSFIPEVMLKPEQRRKLDLLQHLRRQGQQQHNIQSFAMKI